MKSRRTIILIVAVALGALAAVGLLGYVQNAEDSAGEANSSVQVWVAAQPIPKGTPALSAVDQGLLVQQETAAKLSPPTAVVDPEAELAGLVAVADLPVGMPIVTGTFASPSVVNTGITDRLKGTGLTTVTFTVDQGRGAAHLIEPGDYVNVMVERKWETPFWEEEPPLAVTPEAIAELEANLAAGESTRPLISQVFPNDARFVYQKAEVLAIGDALTPDLGDPSIETEEQQTINKSLVTLMVPAEAAQVILNVGRENLYLTLVPEDYEPRAMLPLDLTTQVLPGEDAERLTPYIGFDGVEARDRSTDGLQFGEDGESRVGQTPGAGSSESDAGSAETTAETQSSDAGSADANSDASDDSGEVVDEQLSVEFD